MADLDIALVLKLVDKATAPLRRAVDGMRRTTEQAERAAQPREADDRFEASQERRARSMRRAGAAAAGLGAMLYGTLKPAISFEEAMADVGKVLDMDGDGIKTLGEDIMKLSSTTPMAAEGIASIVAEAAASDVVDKALPDDEERARLIAFAQTASQMGIAFELSADQAGKFMTGVRNMMGLTQEQAVSLGDAINFLDNNTAAHANEIVAVIRRYGAVDWRTLGVNPK